MRYLIILALLSSCAPLYLPATRNAPLFTEQGEAQISGFLSAAGIEAQGAYALSDHIALTGSYAYANQKKRATVLSIPERIIMRKWGWEFTM